MYYRHHPPHMMVALFFVGDIALPPMLHLVVPGGFVWLPLLFFLTRAAS